MANLRTRRQARLELVELKLQVLAEVKNELWLMIQNGNYIISLILGKEKKRDSPRQKSRERHVSCRILHDSICYSPNPEVVYLASSEQSHML